MRYQTPGPCMCGAMDCPNCGPAQGYAICDEDATKDSFSPDSRNAALRRFRTDHSAVSSEEQTDATTDRRCSEATRRARRVSGLRSCRRLASTGYCGADVFR